MSDGQKKPNLLELEAVGGDIAEGGFKFQDHLILERIPVWLACDGFTGMIREALGDTEARFFTPGLGVTREFLEYKNHKMTPAAFWPEIERFRTMDTAHPRGYWRFVLVCTDVSDVLRPILNDLRRLRDALPFYSSVPTIQEASYKPFVQAVQKLGKDENMAAFLFQKVFINADPPKYVEQGFEAFRGSLERHFPVFQDKPARAARSAWEALSALVGSCKAKPINRAELEAAIWSGGGGQPMVGPIRITTANEPLVGGWELAPDLLFDWSAFSGGAERKFPPLDIWNEMVVGQLRAAREWIVATKTLSTYLPVRAEALIGGRRDRCDVQRRLGLCHRHEVPGGGLVHRRPRDTWHGLRVEGRCTFIPRGGRIGGDCRHRP
jgi:hypothetical protein